MHKQAVHNIARSSVLNFLIFKLHFKGIIIQRASWHFFETYFWDIFYKGTGESEIWENVLFCLLIEGIKIASEVKVILHRK